MFKNFRVKNFRGYDCPRKFFNNEIFPDYGTYNHVINDSMDSKIPNIKCDKSSHPYTKKQCITF